MNVREEQHDQVLLLAPEGRLDSNTAPGFEQSLLAQIDAGKHRLLIDLAELEYISSAGLRVLLMAAKRIKAASGVLVLCGMRDHIREVFEISGFLQILTVVDDVPAGLAAAS